jgi:hypothetical protein
MAMSTEKNAVEKRACVNSLVKKSPSEGDKRRAAKGKNSPLQNIYTPKTKITV